MANEVPEKIKRNTQPEEAEIEEINAPPTTEEKLEEVVRQMEQSVANFNVLKGYKQCLEHLLEEEKD